MTKTVAIILVNWKQYAVTADCIRSLQQVMGIKYDIILIDNKSEDNSAEMFNRHFPEIRLIEANANLGFAGGNNLGIAYAVRENYDYIMLLNNDTIVEPDFLTPLISYMEQHPDTGVIQPLIYFQHDRSLVWNGGSYYNRWLSRAHTPGYNKRLQPNSTSLQEVDWVTGCAFFTRASIFQELGMLNDRFFMYYEDVDLSFRIKKAGYRLMYQPESIIYHIAGRSGKEAEKRKEGFIHPITHYYNLRNRIWMVRKYTKPHFIPTSVLYHSFYIASVMIYFILRGRFAKLKAAIRAVKDGLKEKIRRQ